MSEKENHAFDYVIIALSIVFIMSAVFIIINSLVISTGLFVGSLSAGVKGVLPVPGYAPSVKQPVIVNFTVEPDFISILALQGEGKIKSIEIRNLGSAKLDISIESVNLDDFLILGEKSINIEGKSSKTLRLNFFAASGQKTGIYTGKIIVSMGRITKTINVVIEVKEGNPLFDLSVRILPEYKSLASGGDGQAVINMKNLGGGASVVSLRTYVSDFERNIIYESTKEMLGIVSTLSLTRVFKIPEYAPAGKYLLVAEIEYAGVKAEAYDTFDVSEGIAARSIRPVVLVALILALIAFIAYLLPLRRIRLYLRRLWKRMKGKTKREMIVYSEEELSLLMLRRARLAQEIKKLDGAYKEGVLEERGYRKTRKGLMEKLEEITDKIHG
jgi:hypothetical protein